MLAAQDINDLCNNLMQKRDIEHIIVPKKKISTTVLSGYFAL